MRKNILIPVIGGLTGSLGFIIVKDIIEIVKNKKSIKEINFNLKRLLNSGLIIGGFMGSLLLLEEKKIEISDNLKEVNTDIVETIKETKINNSNFSYDAIKEILETTC